MKFHSRDLSEFCVVHCDHAQIRKARWLCGSMHLLWRSVLSTAGRLAGCGVPGLHTMPKMTIEEPLVGSWHGSSLRSSSCKGLLVRYSCHSLFSQVEPLQIAPSWVTGHFWFSSMIRSPAQVRAVPRALVAAGWEWLVPFYILKMELRKEKLSISPICVFLQVQGSSILGRTPHDCSKRRLQRHAASKTKQKRKKACCSLVAGTCRRMPGIGPEHRASRLYALYWGWNWTQVSCGIWLYP